MNDWSKFYNEPIIDDNNINKEDNENITISEQNIEDTNQSKDKRIALTVDDFKGFCERLSGESDFFSGECKSVISYQNYTVENNGELSKESETIYNLNRASVEISFDELHPDLAVVSIKFKSFDDPELRLFWARLQKWRTSMSKRSDNTPIFLIHLLERSSLGNMEEKGEDFGILTADIVNPILCYITREVPTMEAETIINERDEHTGGNVIKMLCTTDFITFSLRNDINTMAIKAEVQREIEEERYINAMQN